MIDLSSIIQEIDNLFTMNKELNKKFTNALESADKIIVVGDDKISSITYYTFYSLAKRKKVLIAKSPKSIGKMNYDLLIRLSVVDNVSPYLKISIEERSKTREEFLLKIPKDLSQSPLLPYLTILNNSTEKEVIESKPTEIIEVINSLTEKINNVRADLSQFGRCFCLGRSTGYALALEICSILSKGLGIHAESYPAGESKHGPIALIEEGFPVIQVIDDPKYEKKMINSIMEMKARGAKIISITSLPSEDINKLSDYNLRIINNGQLKQTFIHSIYLVIALAISNGIK